MVIWTGHPCLSVLEDYAGDKMIKGRDVVAMHVDQCLQCTNDVNRMRREKLAETLRQIGLSEADLAEEEFLEAIAFRKSEERSVRISQRVRFEADPVVIKKFRRPSMVRPGQFWRVAREVQSEAGNTYIAHGAQTYCIVLEGRYRPSDRFAPIQIIPVHEAGVVFASYGDWIFEDPGIEGDHLLAEVWNHSCALVGHLNKYFGRVSKSALDQMRMMVEITNHGLPIPPDLLIASAVAEHCCTDESTIFEFRKKEAEMTRHFYAPTCDIPSPDGPDHDDDDANDDQSEAIE